MPAQAQDLRSALGAEVWFVHDAESLVRTACVSGLANKSRIAPKSVKKDMSPAASAGGSDNTSNSNDAARVRKQLTFPGEGQSRTIAKSLACRDTQLQRVKPLFV